jgi:hypothetical protein
MGTTVRIAAVAGVVGFELLQGLVSAAEARAASTELWAAQVGAPWQNLRPAWWGIGGLVGLLGLAGLIRLWTLNRTEPFQGSGDPFAKYPSANQPCVPNADAAHTPLMLPRVTPETVKHAPRTHARRDAVPERSAPEGNPTGPAECTGTRSGTLLPSPSEVPSQAPRPTEQAAVPTSVSSGEEGKTAVPQWKAERPVEETNVRGEAEKPDSTDDVDPEIGVAAGSGNHRKRSRRERFLSKGAKVAASLPRVGLSRVRGMLRRREKQGK